MTTGVVVMAYGTPASPDDVEAYYTDIRRGRPPSPEQLADLKARYDAIGGISPLAERTEAQRAAIERALEDVAPGEFQVVLGQKHASPTIEEAVRRLSIGMTLSSRTYLPTRRAKLPYARGCVDDLKNTPSGAIDAASDPNETHGSRICFAMLSSEIMK
jgi:DNA-binding phage protein